MPADAAMIRSASTFRGLGFDALQDVQGNLATPSQYRKECRVFLRGHVKTQREGVRHVKA